MTSGMIDHGLSATTAASARVTLRKALADAMRHDLVHRNVAALARPPRRERPDLRYLSPAELRTLLAACEGDPLGPLVTVAATTGRRQGEILGLSWEDVDLEGGRLTVRRALARTWNGGYALAAPKTSRSRRTVNLARVATEALRRQRAWQDDAASAAGPAWSNPDGLVFTDAAGRPLRGTNVTHGFHRLLNAAGLPSIAFHGLRHSAATALLAAGVPLRVVADQLGHTTISITADLYAAVVPELRRDAADAMDRVLEAAQ
jgi:integrase